jgi:hypothetical protein
MIDLFLHNKLLIISPVLQMEFNLSPFFSTKTPTNPPTDPQRIRNKEHVQGNWPTILYLSVSNFQCIRLQEQISSILPGLNFEGVEAHLYHVSLSRTIYVKDHQRGLFQAKIIDALQCLPPLPKQLKIKGETLSVYVNDEGTRTFLAVDVENDEIVLGYISAIDRVLEGFGFPVYYKSPQLHFSVASCTGNQVAEARSALLSLSLGLGEYVQLDGGIVFKCGNKRINFNLNKN